MSSMDAAITHALNGVKYDALRARHVSPLPR